MKKMKRFGLILALVVLTLSLAQGAYAKEFVLGHTGQPSVTFAQAGEKFAEFLAEESGGKLTLKAMGASALGNNREGIEQIQQGVTDFWIISTGLLAQFTKAVTVYDLPYLFKSEKAAQDFVNSDIAMDIVKPLEEKGMQPLGYFIMGWRHIHSNVAVRKPEDLKGVKIRTEPAPIRMGIFKALGASPIPMDFGEVFTSLQQGVIDAGENTLENIKSQGFNTVQKYIIMDGHILDPMLLVMSKRSWDKLSDEDKAIVQKAADRACTWDQENVLANNKKILDEFKAAGTPEVIELTPEERQGFREASKSVLDEHKDSIDMGFYEKIMKFQESYAEEAPNS
jgi:tripartite ATP-independent transporter DctP family solute receptor